MADPLTPAPLRREELSLLADLDAAYQRLVRTPLISPMRPEAEQRVRDALCALALARQAPTPTCATCRFGCVRTVDDDGKAARYCSHLTLRYRFSDENGPEAHFPETFGCALHQPLPLPPAAETGEPS